MDLENIEEHSKKLLEKLSLNDDIINLYLYGSRVYGNSNEKSDWDFTLILNSSKINQKNTQQYGDYDVNFYSKKEFEQMIKEYKFNAIEIIYLPKNYKIIENVDFLKDFKLDKDKLKKSVLLELDLYMKSARDLWNNNKFIKSKKKLYHGLRTTLFTNQLLEHEKIIDFTITNTHWEKIKSKYNSFEELQKDYISLMKTLKKF